MTKLEFLSKYPELNENGEISRIKITLLFGYTDTPVSKGDTKISKIIEDYNKYKVSEVRDRKINLILN
jgi:hypothetical protein